MPITAYRDYSFHYTPNPRTVREAKYKKTTTFKAFKLVVEGKLDALNVFNQLPQEAQGIINEVCQDSFGNKMMQLSPDKQKTVFKMLLGVIEVAQKRSKPKRWWQF